MAEAITEEPEELVVSIGKAAKKFDVSYWTIYRLVQEGILPVVRVRGALRIRVTDLIAYLDAQRPQPEQG